MKAQPSSTGVVVAPLGPRFGAALLDRLGPGLIIGVWSQLLARGVERWLAYSVAFGVALFAWTMVQWWAYATRKAGLGYKVFGLELVGVANGKAIGWPRMALRTLINYALWSLVIPGIVMVIFLVVQERRQGWHDLAAGSLAIARRKNQLAAETVTQQSGRRANSTVGLPPHLYDNAFAATPNPVGPIEQVPQAEQGQPIAGVPRFSAPDAAPGNHADHGAVPGQFTASPAGGVGGVAAPTVAAGHLGAAGAGPAQPGAPGPAAQFTPSSQTPGPFASPVTPPAQFGTPPAAGAGSFGSPSVPAMGQPAGPVHQTSPGHLGSPGQPFGAGPQGAPNQPAPQSFGLPNPGATGQPGAFQPGPGQPGQPLGPMPAQAAPGVPVPPQQQPLVQPSPAIAPPPLSAPPSQQGAGPQQQPAPAHPSTPSVAPPVEPSAPIEPPPTGQQSGSAAAQPSGSMAVPTPTPSPAGLRGTTTAPSNPPLRIKPRPVPSDDEDGTRLVTSQARGGRPAADGWHFRLDDGRDIPLTGLVLIGRSPQPRADEQQATLIAAGGPDHTVSKTHLVMGIDLKGPYLIDRGSTNGTAVLMPTGDLEPCPPHSQVRLREGQVISFGERQLQVLRHPVDRK